MWSKWLNADLPHVPIGKLKWVAVVAPAVLFLIWEYLSHFVLHAEIASEQSLFVLTVVAVGIGASTFTFALFRLLEVMQREIVRQNRELASRTVALETLYEIGTSLSALLDVRSVKETAVRRARQLFGSDTAGLALLREPTGEVRWELMAGSITDEVKKMRLRLGQCVAGKAIQSGEPVIVEDIDLDAEGTKATYPVLVLEELRGALVVPIRIAGKPIGALMVGHRTPYSFHLNDLKLLMSMANQVAVAVNNAQMHERLAALSALEERERLAREMHDGMAQLLGNIAGRATAASEHLGQGNLDRAAEQLAHVREAARDAYLDVRQSILGLRSQPIGSHGLLQALDEYSRRLREQEGINVHLEAGEGIKNVELAPPTEVQAIRIIQEALSNVRKHSQTQEAWVRLCRDEQRISVTIQDCGRGFDLTRVNGRGGHFGLQTMRERAEAVNGRLTIESAPGRGTVVTVLLPVGEEG